MIWGNLTWIKTNGGDGDEARMGAGAGGNKVNQGLKPCKCILSGFLHLIRGGQNWWRAEWND